MKILMLATGILLGIAPALPAQHTVSSSGSRVAGIAPPAVAAAPAAPERHHSRMNGPVFYGSVPVMIFPDGRVFADFGRGYERVVSVCGQSAMGFEPVIPNAGLVQPSVVQPTVVQPPVAPQSATQP